HNDPETPYTTSGLIGLADSDPCRVSIFIGDVSNSSGSDTHHSALPLNTIIPDNVDPATGEGGLTLEFVSRAEDDMDHNLDNMEDGTEDTHAHSGGDGLHHDEGDEQAHRHGSSSTGFVVSSSSGGSGRQVFPIQNLGGDGAGCSLQGDMAPPAPFVLAWHLTTHSILNDAELTETHNQLVDVIRNRNKLADDHKNLQQEHLGCAGKEANLVKKLDVVEKEKDDLLDKSREQEDQIKQLEVDLTSKTSSLAEAEGTASLLNYRRWVVGVKVERSEEDAEAILAAAADYDPECKATFMFAFDSLFTKSYPYVEKPVGSIRLPLGDLQNMWPECEGPTIGCSAANAQ
ncbi:hypothetical protein Tco_0664509, partial [Tanacetum coccineum]